MKKKKSEFLDSIRDGLDSLERVPMGGSMMGDIPGLASERHHHHHVVVRHSDFLLRVSRISGGHARVCARGIEKIRERAH